MGLFDTLGMGNVEADPNALPDNKWAGVIARSYFAMKKNGEVAHVITYKVTEGTKKGAQRDEWWTLGKDPVDAEGNPTTDSKKIADVKTPTMSEQSKPYYKQRWENLGVPLTAESARQPELLVGKNVTFSTKKNGNFINIGFVELRKAAEPGTVSDSTTPGADTGSIISSL